MTAPRRKYRPLLLPISVALLLLALVVVAAVIFRKPPGLLYLRVKPDLALRTVGIITPDDSAVKPTRIPAKFLQALPASMQKILRPFWKPPGDVTAWSVYHDHDGFTLVLDAGRGGGSSAGAGVKNLAARINYGDGWFGEETSLEEYAGGPSRPFVALPLQNVARNYETLTVELLDRSAGWDKDPPVIAAGQMRNPVYTKPAPLTVRHTLPAAEVHGDVTVSLETFVSKAVPLYRKPAGGSDLFTRAAAGDYVRAKGTPLDANYGILQLKVDQAGTTKPEWAVDNVDFFYGDPPLKFEGRANINTTGGLAYAICRNDPGVLQQPVKISVSLTRTKNFTSEEIADILVPIPPHWSLSQVYSAQVWSGKLTAQVSNKSDALFNNDSHTRGRTSQIAMSIVSPSPNMDWRESVFTGHDVPPVELAKFTQFAQFSDTMLTQNLDVYNPKRIAKSAPGFDVSKYTTMSLHLTVPRPYEKKFEFVVLPTEAKGR